VPLERLFDRLFIEVPKYIVKYDIIAAIRISDVFESGGCLSKPGTILKSESKPSRYFFA